MRQRTLWMTLAVVFFASFGALGLIGHEIYRTAPPVPERVVVTDGTVLFTEADIQTGRAVWQSMGGHQLGSIWGHGSYLAPDWSADWLHREALAILDIWAGKTYATPYADLDLEQKAALEARLRREMRHNTYNETTAEIVVSTTRAAAIREVAAHYRELFGDAKALTQLREAYAVPNNAVPDASRREALTAFFFWASWACATERPEGGTTYSSN